MKKQSEQSSYPQILLALLLAAMLVATWVVGLLVVPAGERNNTFYLTLIMLSIAEVLSIVHAVKMSGGRVKRRNMPLQIGGSVMLFLYLAAVCALTIAAVVKVQFNWLLVFHTIALLGLLLGWTLLSFAAQHANAQDKKSKKRLEPFAAIRERYGEFCYHLESSPGYIETSVLQDAIHIRDEVIRYARSDSVSGMVRMDQEIEAIVTSLESAFARLKADANKDAGNADIREALRKLRTAVEQREKRR